MTAMLYIPGKTVDDRLKERLAEYDAATQDGCNAARRAIEILRLKHAEELQFHELELINYQLDRDRRRGQIIYDHEHSDLP